MFKCTTFEGIPYTDKNAFLTKTDMDDKNRYTNLIMSQITGLQIISLTNHSEIEAFSKTKLLPVY